MEFTGKMGLIYYPLKLYCTVVQRPARVLLRTSALFLSPIRVVLRFHHCLDNYSSKMLRNPIRNAHVADVCSL